MSQSQEYNFFFAKTKWGAESSVLLNLDKKLIHSRLDYVQYLDKPGNTHPTPGQMPQISQYTVRLKTNKGNPAHYHVFLTLTSLYEQKPSHIQPFGLRIKPHLQHLKLGLNTLEQTHVCKIPLVNKKQNKNTLPQRGIINFQICTVPPMGLKKSLLYK